jgi:hypothetical protein
MGTPSIERTSHERIVDLIGRVSLRVSWTTTGAFVATISRVNASPAPPRGQALDALVDVVQPVPDLAAVQARALVPQVQAAAPHPDELADLPRDQVQQVVELVQLGERLRDVAERGDRLAVEVHRRTLPAGVPGRAGAVAGGLELLVRSGDRGTHVLL